MNLMVPGHVPFVIDWTTCFKNLVPIVPKLIFRDASAAPRIISETIAFKKECM